MVIAIIEANQITIGGGRRSKRPSTPESAAAACAASQTATPTPARIVRRRRPVGVSPSPVNQVAKTKRASAQGSPPASVASASTNPTPSAATVGTRKTRFADAQLTRRQASSGPIPVKRTSRIASGVV